MEANGIGTRSKTSPPPYVHPTAENGGGGELDAWIICCALESKMTRYYLWVPTYIQMIKSRCNAFKLFMQPLRCDTCKVFDHHSECLKRVKEVVSAMVEDDDGFTKATRKKGKGKQDAAAITDDMQPTSNVSFIHACGETPGTQKPPSIATQLYNRPGGNRNEGTDLLLLQNSFETLKERDKVLDVHDQPHADNEALEDDDDEVEEVYVEQDPRSKTNTKGASTPYKENRPWCILGDFNVSLHVDDKSTGTSTIDTGMRDFQACVEDIKVSDVNSTGLRFTFKEIVAHRWQNVVSGFWMFKEVKRLKFLKKPLRKLLYDHGNVCENVKKLRHELDEAQKALDSDPSNIELQKEEVDYLQAFNDSLLIEERFLMQKAKVEWLKLGDANTAYFHKVIKTLDGYSVAFFKEAWDIISADGIKAIKEFFTNGVLLKELNQTIITLIPKVNTPLRINDYRPISCCNVLYKCISRIISNRMKDSLSSLVRLNQSAFMPGRRISDNILLTQDLMHNYHLDRSTPMWIMECVTSTSFLLSINGSLHGYFKGKRGLCQGDLMLPYLFTLVMKVLTLMLHQKARDSDFTYHWYCSKLNIINLCFADDLFLFAHGDVDSARVIMNTLEEFKNASGLTPNLPKSTTYFCNVLNHVKLDILNILPFKEGKLHVKYLGVPLVPSRLLYQDCMELMEKVKRRINDWKNKSLSLAGSDQLIRLVLSEIRKGKAKVAWDDVCLLKRRVVLVSVVAKIPRHAIHLWLVMRRKLKTQDTLRQWDVWNHMKSFTDIPNIPFDLSSIVDFLIPLAKTRLIRIHGLEAGWLVECSPRAILFFPSPRVFSLGFTWEGFLRRQYRLACITPTVLHRDGSGDLYFLSMPRMNFQIKIDFRNAMECLESSSISPPTTWSKPTLNTPYQNMTSAEEPISLDEKIDKNTLSTLSFSDRMAYKSYLIGNRQHRKSRTKFEELKNFVNNWATTICDDIMNGNGEYTNSQIITNSEQKISDEFLKILQDNTFNGMDGGDVIDDIAKNGGTKCPTCTSDIDGFCNGGEVPGMVRVGSMTYFQDQKWYGELADGKLKDETLTLLRYNRRNHGETDFRGDKNSQYGLKATLINFHRARYAQEAKDNYEVINRKYSLILIPAWCDIDDPDELCRTKEFTVIRHSIGNDEEFVNVGPSKINTVERTPSSMSCIYHELFNKKDHGWEEPYGDLAETMIWDVIGLYMSIPSLRPFMYDTAALLVWRWESGMRVNIPEFDGDTLNPEGFIDWLVALKKFLKLILVYIGNKAVFGWADFQHKGYVWGDCGNVTTDDNEDVTQVIASEKDSIIAPPSTPP
ncbi:hypothetical protein Tco_0529715, partial [Tanacetum coccineum]